MHVIPNSTHENVRMGILLILIYSFFAVISDTCAKSLVSEATVTQVVWGRFFFHALALLIFLGPLKLLELSKTSNPKLQFIRSFMMIATAFFFFTGINAIDLATAHSIFFITPILVTVLSIPILGERIGLRRILGVCVGFSGALVILRPGFDQVPPESLYFVFAAITAAIYQITTRKLGNVDHAYTTLFYTAVFGAFLSSLIVWVEWQALNLAYWALMIALGFTAALGHFFLIKAFQVAPASALMPFSYFSFIWALVIGYLLFNELPDNQTVLGAGIIMGSGIYIYLREEKIRTSSA